MANIKISALPTGTPQGTDETPATDPTDTSSAASGTTKKYFRSAEFNFYLGALGYITFTAAGVATTGALTATYANGALGVGATLTNSGAQVALTIDGVLMTVGVRVLVWQQAAPAQNGIYTVTTVGTGATNWVLTRATDYDQAAEIAQNDLLLVNGGATYAGKSFLQTATGPFTMGTTSIVFVLFSLPTTGGGFIWNAVTVSQAMLVDNGYIANAGGLVSLQLPAVANVGQIIEVAGQGAGGWSITEGAGQLIHYGSATTTTTTGSLSSTNRYDAVRLICIVANSTFTVLSSIGNLTVV